MGNYTPPKKIRIKQVTAFGNQFSNLTPQSEHTVVEPPEHSGNTRQGVWVQGIGKKVKLLTGEFEIVE